MSSGDFRFRHALGWVAMAACSIGLFYAPAGAQINLSIDIEKAPFEYSQTAADNRVSRLVDKLNSKTVQLEYSRETGYLRSILRALEIPESSQTLVFSKTSMQVRYISRRNPRAIYFNDDTYVGWVRGSSLMEISTADPKLGTAFYTVDMMPWRAKVEQAYYDCLRASRGTRFAASIRRSTAAWLRSVSHSSPTTPAHSRSGGVDGM